MDSRRFDEARAAVLCRQSAFQGIGTLGEKTLHAVLKQYFDPCRENQEIRLGPYVADIVGEQGIIEVQTAGFDKLRKKLRYFLEAAPVTIVYPVAAVKWLIWVDPETGETTKRRKSPRRGSPCDILPELYKIKPLLTHPNLKLCIVMLELEEYRRLDGWSENRKKGSSRCDRIPVGIAGEQRIHHPADYGLLIPDDLTEPFTSADFHRAARLSPGRARIGLNVLYAVGAVRRVGKMGNAFLYQKNRILFSEES